MRFLIHAGIGKSGTTTLQDLVFNRHPKILNIGRPNHTTNEYRGFLECLKTGYAFEKDDRAEKFLASNVDRAAREGKTLVLSDEALTAQGAMTQVVACRLHALAPDAHILITIRNQRDAIRSYYANHGRILKSAPKPYYGQHVTFGDWWSHAKENWQQSYLGRISYWDMTRIFITAFGRDRVHVVLFEERVCDPKKFSAGLSTLLSVDAAECEDLLGKAKGQNPRHSARRVIYHGFRQWFLPNIRVSSLLPGGVRLMKLLDRNLRGGKSYETPLSTEVLEEIDVLFGEGNRALAVEYGLDLEGCGYPVGPARAHADVRSLSSA